MTDITVRRLTEDDWQIYREARLHALREAPDAFAKSYEEEAAYDEVIWHERMRRADRLVALRGGEPVAVVSLRPIDDDDFDDAAAEIFSLWVSPELRGSGLSVRVFGAALDEAHRDGHRQLVYWVGTDNPRAVGFASSRGFRPTDKRRAMETGAGEATEEMAMTLAL